jgi:hypothetical protein
MATFTTDALSALQSPPRLVTAAESTSLCERTLQTQESASASQTSGQPRPVRVSVGVRHPTCGAYWTGGRTAHCARCHLTTTGIRAFEAHQRITDGVVQCLPPDEAGLAPHQRPWGTVWSQPGDGATWWEGKP